MTDGLFEEVGINQFQFNVGNQLMYLGIVLFEVRYRFHNVFRSDLHLANCLRSHPISSSTAWGRPFGLAPRSLHGPSDVGVNNVRSVKSTDTALGVLLQRSRPSSKDKDMELT